MLQTYRNTIDQIDERIIDLLSQRFEVVKKVGKFKKDNNIPPLQKDRWQEVLDSRIKKGQKLGIPETTITNIWEEIHKHALDLEK